MNIVIYFYFRFKGHNMRFMTKITNKQIVFIDHFQTIFFLNHSYILSSINITVSEKCEVQILLITGIPLLSNEKEGKMLFEIRKCLKILPFYNLEWPKKHFWC